MGIVQKQGLQNTIISYLGSGLGFVNKLLLLPKIFVLEQVGLVNVLTSFSLLYAQVSGFGVYNVIIRFFPKYEGEERGAFLRLMLKWLLLGFSFLSAMFFLFAQEVKTYLFAKAPLLQEYFDWILPLAFLVLLFEVLDSYSRAILKSVVPSFLKDFALRLWFFAAVICFQFNLISFDQFVWFFVGSYGLNLMLLVIYLLKEGAFKLPKSNVQLSLKPIFGFGIFVFLAESSSLLVSTIDAVMVTQYGGLGNAGVYTTMVFLTSAFMIPYRSMSKVATPIVSRLWQEGDTAEIQKLYSQFSLTSFSLGAIIFLGILANMELLFLFLPDDFRAGIMVLLVIGLARMMELFYGLNNAVVVNSSKYRVDLVFACLLIVLTISSNYLLIPEYGMNGAAVASFVSISAINVARGAFLRKAFGFYLFTKKSMLLISLFAINFALFFWLNLEQVWLELAIENVLLGAFFLLVLYFKLAPELNNWLMKLKAKL